MAGILDNEFAAPNILCLSDHGPQSLIHFNKTDDAAGVVQLPRSNFFPGTKKLDQHKLDQTALREKNVWRDTE